MRKLLGVSPSGPSDEVPKSYVDSADLLRQMRYAVGGTLTSSSTLAVWTTYLLSTSGFLPSWTLPTGAAAGDEILVKRVDAGAGTRGCNIVCGGSDALVGESSTATVNLQGQYDGALFTSDGAGNWYVQRFATGTTAGTANSIPRYSSSGRLTVADASTGTDAVNLNNLLVHQPQPFVYNTAGTHTLSAVQGALYSDCTSGSITFNLPAGSAMDAGDEIVILRKDSSANTITIHPNQTLPDTVNGSSADFTIPAGNDTIRLLPDGTGMWICIWGGLGVSTNTNLTAMRRDSAGRAQVSDPSAAQDIATKNYRDTVLYYEELSYSPPTLVASTFKLLQGISRNHLTGTAAYNTSNGVWTCPRSGIYTITCGCTMGSIVGPTQTGTTTSGTALNPGTRTILALANTLGGTEYARDDQSAGAATPASHQVSITMYVALGTTMLWEAFSTTAGAMTSTPATNSMSFLLHGG